jgi:hypothetical protein
VKIGFGGSLPKEVCSRSSPSLAPWHVLKVVVSHERVCGGLRLLRCGFFGMDGSPRQDPYSE